MASHTVPCDIYYSTTEHRFVNRELDMKHERAFGRLFLGGGHLHICIHTHTYISTCSWVCKCMLGPAVNATVFYYHSPSYPFEIGPLNELIVHWLAILTGQQDLEILLSSPPPKFKVTDVHNHSWFFTWL